MRKIVVSMHTTLDGFVAGPKGEMDCFKVDEEMFDFVNEFTDRADTALYGRVTWQMMDAYWPTAADKPNASRHDKDHSAWYKTVNKVVLSNTMQDHNVGNTTFINGDVPKTVQGLREAKGKNILIFGSPSVIRLLMQHNLIDEYWLFVNPVILGHGIPMFAKLDHRLELLHQATKAFPCGVTAINYIRK